VSMGARTYISTSENLPGQYLPFSRLFAGLLGGGLGPETDGAWHYLAESFWWVHVLALFGFVTFLPFSKHQHLIWVWPNMFFKSLKGSGRLHPMEFSEDAESFGVGK